MLALLAAAAVAVAAIAQPPLAHPRTVVVTSAGPVRGRLHDGIVAFKGIPFAADPSGPRRWHPPQPPAPWSGTLDAVNFSSACAQSGGGYGPSTGEQRDGSSEDCLYLNVYTKNPVQGHKTPVLFYIHGGSLIVGDGRTDFSSFMDHGCESGCVVVVIQYRLDMFGWLAHTALTAEQGGASGNYGLLDQQMALGWVQREIGSFGGDKTKVTVAGQSSGGTSIIALLASPASRGLFSRAISLSGSPNVTIDLATAETQNAQITAPSCAQISALDQPTRFLACMRNASTASLLQARPECWATPAMDVLPMSTAGWLKRGGQQLDLAEGQCGLPVVNGASIAKPILTALREGMVDVPVMLGNVGWETGNAPKNVQGGSISAAGWASYLNSSFATLPGVQSTQEIAQLTSTLEGAFAADFAEAPLKAYKGLLSTFALTCAATVLAKSAKGAVKAPFRSPFYAFLNLWSPAQTVWPTDCTIPRWAYHTWDLTVVLEGWQIGWPGACDYKPTPSDLRHSRFLQTSWYEFMQTGRMDESGWKSAEEAGAAWPRLSSTMVIQDPPVNVVGANATICAALEKAMAPEQRFWWIN